MENLTIEKDVDVVERIKTGIKGLDELIAGGYPKGSFISVVGGPGVGKTIFACQFIAEGLKDGEKCLFISAEQSVNEIIEQARQFGWKFDEWEREGKLKIVFLDPQKLFEIDTIEGLKQLIEENHYDRIVIDSVTSLVSSPLSPSRITDFTAKGLQPHYAFTELRRANVALLVNMIKQKGITTLGISQGVDGMPGHTIETGTEFKSDGLIILDVTSVGKISNRTLQIKKLRKTQIECIPYNFEFTTDGISIMKKDV